MFSYSFLQKVPFVRLAAALLLGILFYNYIGFSPLVVLLSTIVGIGALVVNLFLNSPKIAYRFRWVFGLGIFSLLFCLGLLLSWQKAEKMEFSYYDEYHFYEAEVLSAPTEKPKSILCQVKLLNIVDEQEKVVPLSNKMLLYLQKDSLAQNLQIGQRLLLNVKFTRQNYTGNPEEFDYAKYLSRKGIASSAYVSAENWRMLPYQRKTIRFWAEKCRSRLLNIYRENGFCGEDFAVLAALTLGEKDFITDELQSDFTSAGVTHVLAVSGLHVGVIYFIVLWLLSLWGGKNKHLKIKNVFVILSLCAYAFITGLSPSVVRSVLMFSLVGIGVMTNRRSLVYNTVFLSAFLMLLFNTDYIFDVGFQLSYAAVLSIISFCPFLLGLIKIDRWLPRKAWELFSVSLSAQLGTMPLTIYYFHQFPNYFWVSNMIIVPLSSFVIYAAVSLFFLSSVPIVGAVSAYVLSVLVKSLNGVVHFISDLPYAVSADLGFGAWQFCFLIFAVVFFMSAFILRRPRRIIYSLTSLVIFFLIGTYEILQTSHDKKIIVFSDKSASVIALQSGRNVSVLATDTLQMSRHVQPYKVRHHLSCDEVVLINETADNGEFFTFGGKTFCVLSQNPFVCKDIPEKQINVDYLIITPKSKAKFTDISNFISPKNIVLSASVNSWQTKNLKAEFTQEEISFYEVSQSGAFVQNF